MSLVGLEFHNKKIKSYTHHSFVLVVQEKIIKFLLLKKKTNRSFNSEVRNRKEYRNPDFLTHAVTYQNIDEIGSCFSIDVFNPHGYDKADFYDEIGPLFIYFVYFFLRSVAFSLLYKYNNYLFQQRLI